MLPLYTSMKMPRFYFEWLNDNNIPDSVLARRAWTTIPQIDIDFDLLRKADTINDNINL